MDKLRTTKVFPKRAKEIKEPNLERAKDIKALLKQGHTIAEIADWIGISKRMVYDYIKNYGLRG